MKHYSVAILLFILFSGLSNAQTRKIDSLRKVIANEKEDSNRVNTLNLLGVAYFNASKLDSDIVYSNQAKELAEKIGFERGLAATYCNLANASSFKGNNVSAIGYANKALEISQKTNNPHFTAYAYNILGFTYMGIENYSKALDAFSSGVSVCKKNGDKRNLCACLANIASIYAKQLNYAKALEFDTMALATAREVNYTGAVYPLQNNIRLLYFTIGKYDKAKEYYEASYATGQKLGDKINSFSYNSNMADVYAEEGNYTKALECKFIALASIKEVGKKNDISKGYADVGEIYFKMKNYSATKIYMDSSLTISMAIGELEHIKETYRYLYMLDSINGDTKTELQDYKKYIFYRDSLANEANGKKVTQAEMNYDFARKMDSTHAAQDILNVASANERERQKVIEYGLAGGLALAFIASGIFFFQRRKIAVERMRLKESNEVKDKLFSIISHDLRSPLNLLNGMLSLFKRGKVTADNSEALSQNLEGSMQNTMNLLDNLLSWSHSQMKGFNIKTKKVKPDDIVKEIITLYANAAKQKGVLVENDMNTGIELDADDNILKLVLRNLLNNAIKFSNPGGKIYITPVSKSGYSGFSVKDEGIGIPAGYLELLFKLGNEKKIREGTNNEQGSGLGLVLCDELVTRSGGELKVESLEGKGTTVSVLFPNKTNSVAD